MSSDENSSGSSAATEAADWYARLRAPDVTEIDGLRFRAWISGSPDRRREFEALEALWQGLGDTEQLPAMQRTREAILARRRKAVRPRARRRWAIAASILLCAGAAAWLWQHWTSNVYATDVGELRAIPLSDGSVVTLNTATEVRLRYTETARRIELVNGQASFEVAKDAARPFVVSVGGGEVRAVGTVFDVYKGKDKVTISLLEGKISVSPSLRHSRDRADAIPEAAPTSAAQSEIAPFVLNAGEQVSYVPIAIAERPTPITITAVDVPRVTAWRIRKLAFKDTLVTDAIAEANRYSREQIVLEAPGMETARLSGSFEAGKNEVFAEGLRTFFGLQIERRGEDRIVLTRTAE